MEGEMDTVEFCFTVTEFAPYILRYFTIESTPDSARGECSEKRLSVHIKVLQLFIIRM